MKTNLIPVSKESELKANGIYLKPTTLRKWHHLGRNPNLFLKICSRLHIDMDEWNKIIQKANDERSDRITELKHEYAAL